MVSVLFCLPPVRFTSTGVDDLLWLFKLEFFEFLLNCLFFFVTGWTTAENGKGKGRPVENRFGKAIVKSLFEPRRIIIISLRTTVVIEFGGYALVSIGGRWHGGPARDTAVNPRRKSEIIGRHSYFHLACDPCTPGWFNAVWSLDRIRDRVYPGHFKRTVRPNYSSNTVYTGTFTNNTVRLSSRYCMSARV